jgi:putative ABC transport system ATP-binding protein
MLTARALTKRFGTAPALDGVDFKVGPGESVAVTGPSGSGKSTLLHCLAGIMRPDSGEVRLFDERIDALSERQRSHLRRTRFAFLFQFGQLLPELPADENVALPLMLGGTPRKAALEPARAELRRLGLDGKEDRRPGELSGGEAQRVALARALVVRPAVVFADEPTGALDRATGDQVMGVLLDTVRELDAALVVVTHDPRIAARCTRTIEIRDGRLSGTPRTGNGEGGFDGFVPESVGAGLRAGPAPQGAEALPLRGGVPAGESSASFGAQGGPAAAGPLSAADRGDAPAADAVARVVGNGGDAFAGTGPARDGRTTVMPDAGTALGGAAPVGVQRGAGPDAFAAGSVPVGGAADRGVSAADTVARTVGRGGDAFAPGASGARRNAGPDFGPEPVVEVWR